MMNVAHKIFNLTRQFPERGQVVSEDVDRNVRPRPREHVVDAVTNRLAERGLDTRNGRQILAQGLQ